MRFSIIQQPTLEPIELDEAKAHLRVEHTSEDAMINLMIEAARHHVEGETGRRLLPTQFTAYANLFSDEMELLPNLISVEAIRYLDTDNTQQTLATSVYKVDKTDYSGKVYLAYNQSWPDTYEEVNAVEIDFTVGMAATQEAVPGALKAAMLLIVGHLYENREATTYGTALTALPMGVDALLKQYTIRNLG